jgi:hypothetical protein
MRPSSRLGSAQDNYFENNLAYAGTYNSWIYDFVKSSTSYLAPPATLNWNPYYSTALPTNVTEFSASMPLSASQLTVGADTLTAAYSGNPIATARSTASPPREEERRLRTTRAQPRLRSR